MTTIDRLASRIAGLVGERYGVPFDAAAVTLETPPDPSLGDLAFGCFPLAKLCRQAPQKIAAELAGALEGDGDLLEARAAGPYLNLVLDKAGWFAETLGAWLGDGPELRLPEGQRRKVAVEFSCPNTNKPQHLGHVRNNILGDGLSRLLAAAGHDVVKVNLINDRGIHICKSMLAWKLWGEGETPASSGLKGDHLVGRYYVLFATRLAEERAAWLAARELDGPVDDKLNARFEAESALLEQARAMLRLWEAGDEETVDLWKTMNGWVLAGFEETYARQGIRFDRLYLESQLWTLGKSEVLEALERGVFRRNETGAVVCPLDELGLEPKVLLRSDGTSLYMTQDIGVALTRQRELGFDTMIYVVGNEQEHHFRVLFHVLGRLGHAWAERLTHFSYGMVNLTSGKMKSREGRVVDADDLLDELEASCRRVMDESEKRGDLAGPEKDAIVRSLALGALKYYILKVNPRLDMIYDPEDSIDLAGNTGPYLQYAHARIRSLVRKSGLQPEDCQDFGKLGNPEEVEVLKALALWPAEVRQAAQQLNPARVAQRSYELARVFSRFFAAHSVFDRVDDPDLARQRIAMVAAVGAALRQGLDLMGVDAPERI